MTVRSIPYIPKPDSVAEFGCSSQDELDTWRPEICGVCCLKMVGDAEGKTTTKSLWQITQDCRRAQAFVEHPNGEIEGIFYKPMLRVASQYGLSGRKYRRLYLWRIKSLLRKGQVPILSIQLDKVDAKYRGSHLVVVTDYNQQEDTFTVNDPSSVVAKSGDAVILTSNKLRHISNRRGISFK